MHRQRDDASHTHRFGRLVDTLAVDAHVAGLDYRLLPEVTILYRRHGASMTHGLDAAGKGYLMAIKKSLDRRRRTPP